LRTSGAWTSLASKLPPKSLIKACKYNVDAIAPLLFRGPMAFPTDQPPSSSTRTFGALRITALILWSILLVVVFIRAGFSPQKNTVVTTYVNAGHAWLTSADVYKGIRGFVYSPVTAAFFAPLSLIPMLAANIVWRLLTTAVFLGGVAWWLKTDLHRWIPERRHTLVFILLFPLAIGNFNNGQVNPLVIGLLMMGIIAAHRERFTLAAFCIAVATYFKIYPLAVGLLLILLFPRKFSWRLIVALIVIGALSFLLQRPSYVLHQYELWWQTRMTDNRMQYSYDIAPRDLYLLFRLAHIDISRQLYTVVQLLSGAAIGLICLVGRYKRWSEDRLLAGMFSLVCGWMLLCGPATESATYVMLAPAAVLALAQAYCRPMPLSMRTLITSSFVVLLMALTMNSFMNLKKCPASMCVQPIGALIFVCYSGLLVTRSKYWKAT